MTASGLHLGQYVESGVPTGIVDATHSSEGDIVLPPKKSASKAHVHYHKDGTVWARGRLQKGLMTGYWEWFRKDGSLMRSGSFAHGAQVDDWTTYARDGRVVRVTPMKPKRT